MVSIMRRLSAGIAASTLLAVLPLAATSLAGAQTTTAVERSARVAAAFDAGQKVRLTGHVPAYADANKLPSAALSSGQKFQHLTMVLSRAPEVQAAFEQLLADQVNPSSPRYHQWLTPAQVGTLYGPAQSDVDAVTAWLQSQGLSVNSVSPNRLFVDFSGPVGSVESAFGTSFRTFSLANGEQRYSLTQEPSVPAAIQPVITTIAGLSQSIHYPASHHGELKTVTSMNAGQRPQYTFPSTSGTEYFLMAGDFSTAYDVNSVYTSGVTGTGQNVAIVGESRVDATDISTLETLEGVAVKQANVIVPPTGVDPGTPGDTTKKDNGYQDEATLDVNRVTGTAPGSTVDLIVSGDVNGGTTIATDGLFIAINYAISTVNDPILTISFGGCEYLNGSATTQYEANLFQTAASQGISTFISSGDSGAAGCNGLGTASANYVLSINDFCASGYVTCMGGTEFAASTNSSTYWSATNGANYASLQSYPPEGAWNDVSQATNGTYSFGSSGGGVSQYITRPSWQTGTGIPAGTTRVVPDLALMSSPNNGFVTCLNYLGATCALSSNSTATYITYFYTFGGTSAAAPSMAGIQALVNQKAGGRQGNINPTIYSLANGTSNPFHDVTVATSGVTNCTTATPSLCNNSVPGTTSLTTGGLAGYAVNSGWDAVTGWGSVDVAKYVAAVISSLTPTFSIVPAATNLSLSYVSGSTVTDTINLASVNSFAGTVALSCAVTTASGTAAGTCSVSPTSSTLSAGGTGSTTLTITDTATNAAGTLNVTVTGTSGGATVTSATIAVTVTGPTFTVTSATATASLGSGTTTSTVTDSLTITSINAFSGSVGLTCKVTTASGSGAGTCTVAPSPVTLASGTSSNATLTVTNSTVGASGSLTVVVTGTSGAITASTTVTVTVVAPTFTIVASPSSLNFTSGASSGNTSTLTLTSVGSFVGNVALTCAVSTSSAAFQPTCAVSPTSASLTAGGTGTATLSIGSTTATTAAQKGGLVAANRGWGLGGGVAFAMLLCCTPLRRRRKAFAGVMMVLLLAGLGAMTGCSNSSTVAIPVTKSSAGSYTVTITGTGTSMGSTTAATVTTTVAVTIN